MLRILARITIFGSKAIAEDVASFVQFHDGELMQCGLRRRPPVKDIWCYSTKWYRFNSSRLNEELLDFLHSHIALKEIIPFRLDNLEYAQLVLCPVGQTFEREFSFYLQREILSTLDGMGLALELAPASVMPEAPYWTPGVRGLR